MQFVFNTCFHLEIFMVCWLWCYFLLIFDDTNKHENSCPITGAIASTVVALDIQVSTEGISTECRGRL